ncbi:MAG: exosortase/archaeosortase family protein [Verrucomicrobiota bacterium]
MNLTDSPKTMQTANASTVGVLDEFQTEIVSAWRQVPNKGLFLVLLAAWCLMFQFLGNSLLGYIHSPSLFAWMNEAYNSPNKEAADDSIGNFIPILVLGILWWKRKELLAQRMRIWLPAFGVVILGLLLHMTGYFVQEPRLSILGFFAGVYGFVGLVWGPGMMAATFFPFFLFVFSVPLGNHSDKITFGLRLMVTQIVEFIAHTLLGIDVLRQGTGLYSPGGGFQYDVAAACSGIRSLFAILLISTIYGFLSFKPLWKRLLMVAMALPFAVIGNVLRLLCIVVAAEIGGQKAGDYVHEGGPMGLISLLPYVPAILGVLMLGRWLEDPAPAPSKVEEPRS